MAMQGTPRLLLSGAIAATALAGAVAVDAPVWAALLGIIAGALAAVVSWRPQLFPEGRGVPEPNIPDEMRWAREVLGALSEPTLLLRDGRVYAANPAARQLLGDWIEGKDVRLALRHPATVDRLSQRPPAQGEVDQIEVMGIGQGDRRWLMTIAGLAEDYRLVRFSDRSEAQAAEQMRVDFVANASHELRTPLATILGFLETLRDEAAGGDRDLRNRFLRIMHDEGKRMQQLIEDLMSLSRIEAERFTPPRDAVDLLPLVEEVRVGFGQLLSAKRNELRVEADSVSTLVPGDRSQLLQLIMNLVANAVKYGRDESVVTVRVEDDSPEMIRLSVIDCGDGIPPEHLPRLTERFYRVDAGRSRAEGGTGLGLAIVKHIVGRHRGRLDIRSKVGEGTTVQVLLPRAPDPVS
jgi:two-component system phosphate regulon sensor histidine kinase PhoR